MVAMLYQWMVFVGLLMSVDRAGSYPLHIQNAASIKHPFYIAVTEINQNAKDQSLEVSCKMFAEDLEVILEKNYKTVLDISLQKDKPAFDRLIADYLKKQLIIQIDGKVVTPEYVGFEKENESVYCYFEVTGVKSFKKIDIINQILYDFNKAQINIIHVTVNGKRQSKKLDYPDKEVNFIY